MKKTFLTIALGSLALVSQAFVDAGKNVLPVCEGSLPSDLSELLKRKELWNFNFRPMGSTAAELFFSDPIYQRHALSGEGDENDYATAVGCLWNEDGFSFVVYCVQPGMKAALEKGEAAPDGSFEIYFERGDMDGRDAMPYYQFWVSGEGAKGKCENYAWTVIDRNLFDVPGLTEHTFRILPNGYIHALTVPWKAFWNALPFSRRTDNFWRMQVNRWTPKAWLTWGGYVHEHSRFGYLRWPKFTAAQKARIQERLLTVAWAEFLALSNSSSYRTPGGWNRIGPSDDKRWIRDEKKLVGETYYNYSQDGGFHPTLTRLNDERRALGKGIAGFMKLDEAARDAFYDRAADMLFNYRYDVEEAYAKYQNELNMKGE